MQSKTILQWKLPLSKEVHDMKATIISATILMVLIAVACTTRQMPQQKETSPAPSVGAETPADDSTLEMGDAGGNSDDLSTQEVDDLNLDQFDI